MSASSFSEAPRDGDGKEQADLLFGILLDVVERHDPELIPLLRGQAALSGCTPGTLGRALQAQGIWFQLLSIAEQNAAMRRLREEERRAGGALPGSFDAVIQAAAASGVTPEAMADRLASLRIRPVITAHPTEARRVTILEKLREIYLLLLDLENSRWTPRERARITRRIRDQVELIWLTGDLRLEKSTVEQEIQWGLYFFQETLFEVVPNIVAALEDALAQAYPGQPIDPGPLLQMGSWIGGDRDGNPTVTAEVTRAALLANAQASLAWYRTKLTALLRQLSIAAAFLPGTPLFRTAVDGALAASPAGRLIAARNPGEPFRQFVAIMLARAEGPAARLAGDAAPASYASADELTADLITLERGLQESGCGTLAADLVRRLRRAVEIFRFSTVRLDLRQNTTRLNQTLRGLWAAAHGDAPAPDPASAAWKQWILSALETPRRAGQRPPLEPGAEELVELFRLVRDTQSTLDREAFGGFILSMTHSAADVLGAYLVAKEAGLFLDSAGVELCTLPIVPLFETISDLRAAPGIMRELLDVPMVRRSIRRQGNTQDVMIGYSDSNKDGGYFSANWELAKVQAKLTALGESAGVQIAFFHGRGGSVSRGGAPTQRAIAAQPAGSIRGRFRITEQGEVVSFKYANRGTASHQLELLASSVLDHVLARQAAPRHEAEFDDAMEALSGAANAAYRNLLGHPGLLAYFRQASPLEEIALLNIGSRPARRFQGSASLDDLRAIPFVFAWAQNRHAITGWFGIGSGIDTFLQVRGGEALHLLRRMFREHRLFRLIIDEAEKTLATVDLGIARDYAALVDSEAARDAVFAMIAREFELTCARIVEISEAPRIAERFERYRGRLAVRLPMIDAVNREQVELLRRYRCSADETAKAALLRSINCIAAGFGTTG